MSIAQIPYLNDMPEAGQKETIPNIPWPIADEEIQSAIAESIHSGSWGQYHGPNLCVFEEELAQYFHVTHALTCASGTLAVEAALRAVGVGPGDEVIMAAYDYEANFLNIHAIGAKPVLVDVLCDLGEGSIQTAKTPQTKAILVSHLHGELVSMTKLRAYADQHNIPIIEDSAQSPGAFVDGKPTGSWGDIGILSFGGSKLLSAGRGGAILTNNSKLHQRAKVWLSRGVQQWAAISELQAIVLRPQLRKLSERTRLRFEGVCRLNEKLKQSDVKGLTLLVDREKLQTKELPAFYKVGFWYAPELFGLSRDEFCKTMRNLGIAFDPGFSALHIGRSPSRFRQVGNLGKAQKMHDFCVILHHPVLLAGNEIIDLLADLITKTYRKLRIES